MTPITAHATLHGFLLAHGAPPHILNALEMLTPSPALPAWLPTTQPHKAQPQKPAPKHSEKRKDSTRNWTPENLERLRRMAASHSLEEMAEAFGRSPKGVYQILLKQGIRLRDIRKQAQQPAPEPTASTGKGRTTWRKNAARLMQESMSPTLHGQTQTYLDEQGNTITQYPPGYAHGITPQKSVNETR